MPSFQLSRYLQARADGVAVEAACELSGIGLVEAELHEADIESGERSLPPPSSTKERQMPKHDQVTEIVAPDFAKMKRIFLNDLKPAEEKSAKARGDQSAAWSAVEKDAHCNKKGAKWAYWLLGQSEESRDDVLRTFYGALQALGIGISQDLVDKMNDSDAPTMPIVDSKGLGAENLATIGDQRKEDADAFDNDQLATAPAA